MLARFDHYTAATKAFINPFATIPIRADAINLVLTKQGTELFNRLLGAEWRTYLAHCIEHGRHSLLVSNRQRETVTCTTRWVGERAIDVAPIIGPLSNAGIDTCLNAFRSDKALDVSSKLSAIFCSSPDGIFLIFLVDELLR